ncbi:ABC transporter substrate-binding protein [soil metagenome]
MRRLLAVLMAFTLLAAACGRDDDDDDAATDDGDSSEDGGGELSAGPGFDGTTITLGVITPTTGPAAIIGNPLTAGNQVWFDRVNADGGIAGQYPVELVVENNEYSTQVTIEAYNRVKEDVAMFAQILGTPPTNAVLPQLTQDEIVASPASLDEEWVREQYLLPLGGPYQIQAINALEYYLNDGGGSTDDTICVLRSDDPYGEAGLEGVEFAAEEMGFEIAEQPTFTAGAGDFTAQLGTLSGADCQMVFLVSLPSDAAPILGGAAASGFAPQWIGQSPTWVTALALSPELGPYLAENFWLASQGFQWGDESDPAMAGMLADVAEFAPDQAPDIYFVFGYVQAQAITEVLEAAVENGDLSREGIVEAMNGLETMTEDGLLGTYEWGAPEDRNPPRVSTVFSVNPDAPSGLEALSEENFTSDAAEAFEFAGS